jgi:hypothetical protein
MRFPPHRQILERIALTHPGGQSLVDRRLEPTKLLLLLLIAAD